MDAERPNRLRRDDAVVRGGMIEATLENPITAI